MRFSKEEEYLRQKDKKLKKIIDTNGHIVYKPNKKNQFDTLVGIVISQFISTKAANSIFKNIRGYFNSEYLNENHFEKLNINPSTVSRIVRNKFIQLPDRISSLANLLERRVNRRSEGNDVTIDDLKYLINEIISEEDESYPLSDQDLTRVLKEKLGIILSRRTVAKYRSNLNIPSSRERQIN